MRHNGTLEPCQIRWDFFGKIASDSVMTKVEDCCLSGTDKSFHVIYGNIWSFRIAGLKKNKELCSTPKKGSADFWKLPFVSKVSKKRKKKAEPLKGSAFYSTEEPSLEEPFLKFRTAEKGFVGKYETIRVQY
jgi:hypothetical protein